MSQTRVAPKGPISTVIHQVQTTAARRRPRLASGTLTLQTPDGLYVRPRKRDAGANTDSLNTVPGWG